MQIITQGRPRSSYFYIIQPPGVKVAIGEEIKCINPVNEKETIAICHAKITYAWSDVSDCFCLRNYGWNAQEIKTKIEEKYPELKNTTEVKFLFLKVKK